MLNDLVSASLMNYVLAGNIILLQDKMLTLKMLDEEGKKSCEVIYEYAQDESKHESLAAFSECQAIVQWVQSHSKG